MGKNKGAPTTVNGPAVGGNGESPRSAGTNIADAPAPPSAQPAERDGADVGLAEQLIHGVAETVRVAHQVLPRRLPAYLAGGALLLAGVIDPPVALAGGLAYEALRRWTPQQR